MRLQNERAVSHFLNVFVAEVATSLVYVSVVLRNDELLCESYWFLVFRKLTVWYCNCSYLTVGSSFPCRNCPSVC